MRWEMLIGQRQWCWKMGLTMFGLAFIAAALQVWKPVTLPISVLFATWGMWMFSTHQLLGQIANMQARFDMLLVGQGKEPE